MSALRRTRAGLRRLSGFFLRRRREREMSEEFESHLQLHIDENIRAGMSPEAARRDAMLKFGPVEAIKDAYRDRAGLPPADRVARDLRYAVRVLRRHPGFSAAAIATLSLGIAAGAAVFSVVDAVFLRPLPYSDPDRLVGVPGSEGQFFVTFSDQITLQPRFEGMRTFAPLGVYARGGLNVGGTSAQRVSAAAVTPEFFRALGLSPQAGRLFTAADLAAGDELVVVGHRFWREHLGARPDVVGSTLSLNGRTFIVLGLMPPDVSFPGQSQLWVPSGAIDQMLGSVPVFSLVGRLAPGVTAADARAELIERGKFTGKFAQSLSVVALREELVGQLRPIAGIVAIAAALVLLVACINAANLLLARVAARDREFSVRRAVGATRMHLVTQVLAESVVLAATAACLALPITHVLLGIATSLLPASLHGIDAIGLGGRAFAATAALAGITAIAFGLAPSLSIRRARSADLFRGAQATTMNPFWRRFRSCLLIGEIAIAVLLLAGAATLGATILQLMRTDTGASGERALVMELTLPDASYRQPVRVQAFHDAFETAVAALPGVEAVGMTNQLPGAAASLLLAAPIQVRDRPAQISGGERRPMAIRLVASPGYFDALGIRFLAGRTFSETAGGPEVVVSEGYARAAGLRPEQLIGREAAWESRRDNAWATIVGVVSDVRMNGPEHQFRPAVYGPSAADPWALRTAFIVVKAVGRPGAVVSSIRAELSRIDPNLPLYNVRTYADVRASTFAERRFGMFTTVAFAALAFSLAVVGLYGVIAYLVQLRTREIGIRLAIGATPAHVRREVLRSGLMHAMAGIAAGAALAIGTSRISMAGLAGISRLELDMLAWIAVAVLAVAFVATSIPARRATRIDPMLTLRAE